MIQTNNHFFVCKSYLDSPKAPTSECYGGVSRHLTKINELKSTSAAQNKIFLNLNAGGMLGGYIWYPILGPAPAVESIKMLNFNAVVNIRLSKSNA